MPTKKKAVKKAVKKKDVVLSAAGHAYYSILYNMLVDLQWHMYVEIKSLNKKALKMTKEEIVKELKEIDKWVEVARDKAHTVARQQSGYKGKG